MQKLKKIGILELKIQLLKLKIHQLLFEQFRDDKRASNLQSRSIEIIKSGEQREKRLKQNEQSFCNLWDNIRGPNVCVIGVPEGRARENGAGEIFDEITAESFLILIKDMKLWIWEAQCVPRTE